jgi:hypothetical protein
VFIAPDEDGTLCELGHCLGNPVEGERDSGLKPNTIPL